MKRKKKNKFKAFIFLLFLIFLTVYGGLKGGEYLANKLAKPIIDNAGQDSPIAENDKVEAAAVITEFITAEHLKKDSKLVTMVDKTYYNTFSKGLKQLPQSEVTIQDINYKDLSKDKVKIEAVFLKGTKKESENIVLKKSDGLWKVIQVDR